jgi:hypothetical protein
LFWNAALFVKLWSKDKINWCPFHTGNLTREEILSSQVRERVIDCKGARTFYYHHFIINDFLWLIWQSITSVWFLKFSVNIPFNQEQPTMLWVFSTETVGILNENNGLWMNVHTGNLTREEILSSQVRERVIDCKGARTEFYML